MHLTMMYAEDDNKSMTIVYSKFGIRFN